MCYYLRWWICIITGDVLIHLAPSVFLCSLHLSIFLNHIYSSLPFLWLSPYKADVILSHTCHTEASLLSFCALSLQPLSSHTRPPFCFPPPFLLRTSIEHHCHTVPRCIHPFGRAHTPLLVLLRTVRTPPSPSDLLVTYWGFESPLRGDKWAIKYLWINIHSNVWQWRNPVTGKVTWLVCAAGEAQSLSSACVHVCLFLCCSVCVGRWCYCGGHSFGLSF